MQQFLIFLFCFCISFSTAFSFELGDTAIFAVRFDDKTGNLTEIVYHGETVTISGGGDQRFDIMQDSNWVFGKSKLELAGIEKRSATDVTVT
ncbi:MAG: hypothetical protein LBK82_10350, partial [Planctomycetaceae bacterium]|nr:hypothetical protein [Planctomycetaceae bacterium]